MRPAQYLEVTRTPGEHEVAPRTPGANVDDAGIPPRWSNQRPPPSPLNAAQRALRQQMLKESLARKAQQDGQRSESKVALGERWLDLEMVRR
jgi:hypothetical protein